MDRCRVIVVVRSLVAIVLLSTTWCMAEKLSPDQKAPPFARGSGGLILKTPFEGEQRFGGGQPAASSNVDGIQREEKEDYKEVDGQLVRTVEGSFSYKSPEGLPVSVKYTADENGNRASFKFGTAAGGGGGGGGGGGPGTAGGQKPSGPYPSGRPDGSAGGKGQGSDTYLPPGAEKDKKVDRSYLPPQ